jgi:hypothetical protein
MSRARSASGVLIALAVGGCTTTQEVNKRYELRAQRVLAGRKPVRVTTPNPQVAVGRVSVVRGHGTAFVVELTNTTGEALADLPISVGIGRRYVNERRGLDYFQTRVAAIAPHGQVRWVFATHGQVPKHGRPFARVGTQDAPRAVAAAALPRISVSGEAGHARLTNRSGIPQYNLPVYALVRRGGRYVAAGRATVEELDHHASVAIPMRGKPGGPVELEALPTILR